jgi:hypothetical protein
VVSDSEDDSDGPWQHLPKNNSKRPCMSMMLSMSCGCPMHYCCGTRPQPNAAPRPHTVSSDEDEDEALANLFTQVYV